MLVAYTSSGILVFVDRPVSSLRFDNISFSFLVNYQALRFRFLVPSIFSDIVCSILGSFCLMGGGYRTEP